MSLIRVKKSKLVCPMSLSLMDPAGNEVRRIECTLPRMHLGHCTDGQGTAWSMPKKFVERLERMMAEDERLAKRLKR